MKKVLISYTFCISFFIAAFDNQVNIHCIVSCISGPISSHDHNSTDQAIAMERYQSCFRKTENLFSGNQQAALKTDQKIYSLYIFYFIYNVIYNFLLSKDFQSSCITFDIFNNSTLFYTAEK